MQPELQPVYTMNERFASAGKDVLVQLVKFAQKRGMQGCKGDWKDFLGSYDKKFGASLCDPTRRSPDALLAFLNTLSEEDDLKYLEKLMEFQVNRDAVLKLQKNSADVETPEQRLVRLTLEHHQYPLNYLFPSHEEGWLVTKRSKKSEAMGSTAMISVDCEMVLCEDGTEALVRVCVVDRNLEVKLDKFVSPNKAVADYRTEITGISAQDLDRGTCSLKYVQKSLKNLLKNGPILVGHGLNNDLQSLKIDHARVIDTSLVFKYPDGVNFRRPSLNDLCKAVLGFELRKEGAPHSCIDDASAAMKLVLAKVEGGVDNVIPFSQKDVPETEMTKLLVHRIPISLPKEALHKIIPGDFTIEIKANKKAGGMVYSLFAIFKNTQQANEAFEDLDGKLDLDSSGRPQKFVPFQLSTGETSNLCVCKMTRVGQLGQTPSKKRSQEDETFVESKKLKLDETIGELENTRACNNHLKEIEKLKLQLSLRDQEISKLNKIIVTLSRKQKL